MFFELNAERLSLKIKQKGAELTSMKLDEKELLWQGSEQFWTGQAPILFPIVCCLKNDCYKYDGTEYQMEPHGFAMKSDFSFKTRTASSITLSLTDNEQSMRQYPFAFEFDVCYALEKNRFMQSYTVTNRSDKVMPFSLGGHTALRCPMHDTDSLLDYYVQFDHPVTLDRQLKTISGLLTHEKSRLITKQDKLPLNYELFSKEAIILLNSPEKHLVLKNKTGTYNAEYDVKDYADLGIWTMQEAPFICIEPWNGYDSYVDSSEELSNKPGIRLLEPGQSKSFSYSIVFTLG